MIKKRFELRGFLHDARGVSGIEFALVAPILTIVMVGVIDIGGMVATKLDLNASVSTASAYAQMNAANVTSANGASLASTLALVIANARGPSWANADALVNNGPGSSVTSGAQAARGASSPADSCYCPSKTGSTVTWGSALTCNAACGSGAIAAKYVALTATKQYTPIFFQSFSGQMSSSALIQTN